MASYVNDLRLKEIGTGESSGTWGTETNTNLELIGDALGFGTEAITTNADTHTTTVADGSADAGRAMYIKYTGTLDSACTITIGPNTINRMHFIENATTGSQNIIISQGTGSNVTIPAGDVKAVYLDGAGSGAAVADAFTDLNLAGTTTVDALNVSGALTGSSTIQGTTITATTAFVPDASDGAALGTSSLEFSDLFLADAAVINLGDDQDTTLTHVADTGILLNSTRQLQFGDSGTYIHQSADGVLDLVSDTEIEINATTIDMNGAADVSGALTAATINGVGISSGISNFSQSILISQDAGTGTLSTAGDNTGLGFDVFDDLTSGDFNTALGSSALSKLTTGSENVAIGGNSLDANTTGSFNVAVGTSALGANTTASNNTAIGTNALVANTTGASNVAVGKASLDANTTGGSNTAVGAESLTANTTGSNLTAVGLGALEANTTADHNTAVGSGALALNTTGDSNTAVGSQSLDANTTGVNNVAIGRQALDNSTTGSRNVAVGTNALDASTTAGSNTAVGDSAAKALTTGTGVVAIGAGAFEASNSSAVVAVGTSAALNNTTGANFVAVGNNAARSNTEGVQFVAVGDDALFANTTGNYNHAFGQGVLDANTTGSNNTGVGAYALSANTTADNNTGIGYHVLIANTTGAENTSVGSLSSDALTTGNGVVAVGYKALSSDTKGNRAVALGHETLANQNFTTSTNNYNVAVGFQAMNVNTTGLYNVAVGGLALDANTTGQNNVAIGTDALGANTTASSNVAVGSFSLDANTTGADNVAIGTNAATNQTTASHNTIVGASAGATVTDASSCILIGREANISSSGNSELVIGNSVVGKGDNTGFIAPPGGGNLFQASNTTTFAQVSDARIKKNIVDNNEGLSKLKYIQVRNFEYKTEDEITELPTYTAIKKEGLQLGVIAQEVEDILPDIVHTEDTGCKTVNADNMTWYLVNAVKELSAQVEELKTKLNEGE